MELEALDLAALSARIRRLAPIEVPAAAPALAEVLLDCIAGGASVSFMADLTAERAEAFWAGQPAEHVVIVAEDEGGIVGCVMVMPAVQDNQPHRADVGKMLVHRRARRQGLGAALMREAEAAARDLGKTLLTLDTVTGGDAERLYAGLGWERVGVIRDYALFPDGRLCDTTVFFRRLG